MLSGWIGRPAVDRVNGLGQCDAEAAERLGEQVLGSSCLTSRPFGDRQILRRNEAAPVAPRTIATPARDVLSLLVHRLPDAGRRRLCAAAAARL